jgi:hypothetical protein
MYDSDVAAQRHRSSILIFLQYEQYPSLRSHASRVSSTNLKIESSPYSTKLREVGILQLAFRVADTQKDGYQVG